MLWKRRPAMTLSGAELAPALALVQSTAAHDGYRAPARLAYCVSHPAHTG